MQSELKPCPLCQSKNVTDWTMGGYWEVPKRCGLVRCQDCGCHAPTTAWNTRASDAERREPDANENPYSRARLNSENTKLRAEITRLTEALCFIGKWVERGVFDKQISARESLEVIINLPGMPWNSDRWDVDHKPYAAAYYARFPAALKGPSHD